jgi:membrane-bound lytic murein transglycosylase A
VRLVPSLAPPALLDDADPASLRTAVDRSLQWLSRLPPDSTLQFGARAVSAGTMAAAFQEFSAYLATSPTPDALREWVLARFDVVEMSGDTPGNVMVTGYFEPLIPGSRTRTERAQIPVYGPPADLVAVRLRDFRPTLPDEQIFGRIEGNRFVPYYDRAQIQGENALAGRGLEIAWVEDRVDLFFVEIQGSGAIQFADGGELRIGYAGGNGRPYRAIGRLLIDEGHVPAERMSMQAIRTWLAENPSQVDRVLDYNPSVVFFRPLDTPPVGALGVPVTGGRSVATDLSLFPRGALAFLETTRPRLDSQGNVVPGEPLRRFVLNQDTGGAIRGPNRADFFWGRGAEAATLAGLMQQQGRLVLLVPRAP